MGKLNESTKEWLDRLKAERQKKANLFESLCGKTVEIKNADENGIDLICDGRIISIYPHLPDYDRPELDIEEGA